MYYRHRVFHPPLGRFVSRDPGDVTSLSKSRYHVYFGFVSPLGRIHRTSQKARAALAAASIASIPGGDAVAFCRVELMCVHLVVPGGPRHCGLEVHGPNGIRYFHIVASSMGINLKDRCVFAREDCGSFYR